MTILLSDCDNWDPNFLSLVRSATHRTISTLELQAPSLARGTLKWLGSHCDITRPEEYFTHPESLPFLALPFWLETDIRGDVDLDFQSDLIYSSVNGYYFIRMLDDVMDGHAILPPVLPALAIFHMNFLNSFSKCFDRSHAFWDFHREVWTASAEITSIDSSLQDISESAFSEYSGRKGLGAALPIGAVCYRYDRCDLLPQWLDFFCQLARWNQMRDDLVDWNKDYSAGRITWLLSEATRRKAKETSLATWMAREGLPWAIMQLNLWMEQLITTAASLRSHELLRYLRLRQALFAERTITMVESMSELTTRLGSERQAVTTANQL